MRMILVVAASVLLATVLYAGQPAGEAVTMATEYGLRRSQIASFDTGLCLRLVNFGKVALYRGRYLEAKRFFWMAVLVDPTSKLAWGLYDQAVLHALAHGVENYPGLLGLPGLSDKPAAAPAAKPEVEEGC